MLKVLPRCCKSSNGLSYRKKKTDDKDRTSNYRPVAVLNIFSKVYEMVLKRKLVSTLKDYMFPFISVYKDGYNTQHVLVRLIEEWCKK